MAPSGKRVAPDDTSNAAAKKTKTDSCSLLSASLGVVVKQKTMKPPMKEEKSDTGLTDMPWEMQAQIFEHLPIESLYNITLTNQLFYNEGIYAIRKKEKNNLLLWVNATSQPQTEVSLLHIDGENFQVFLDEKSPYFCDEISKLLYIIINSNNVSLVKLQLNLDFSATKRRGDPLPFEKYFLPASVSNKIEIGALTTYNPEVLSLLRFVCPKDLCIFFPCAELFDKDGKLATVGVRSLTLISLWDVDTVDAVMEQCDVSHIILKGHSYWSDDSIKKVLTAISNSNTACRRWITCEYFNVCHAKKLQRTRAQWKELFAAWQSRYTRADPNFHRARRIWIDFSSPRPEYDEFGYPEIGHRSIVTFYLN